MLNRLKMYAGLGRLAMMALAVVAFCAVQVPASAQRATPEILAKERSDPAAGETVIINGSSKGTKIGEPAKRERSSAKTSTTDAPDPYGPVKRESLAIEPPAPKRAVAAPPQDTASSRVGRFSAPTETESQPEAAPPLPRVNRDVSTRTARLRNEADSDARSPEQESDRPSFDRRGDETYRGPETRWRDRYGDRPDFRPDSQPDYQRFDGYRQRAARADRPRADRPWQHCRRLAWRCDDGFERACRIWDRLC